MAVKLIFESTERSESNTQLECMCNQFNEIYLSIDADDYPPSYICLDRDTAIKLVKKLKTEINKMGVTNE